MFFFLIFENQSLPHLMLLTVDVLEVDALVVYVIQLDVSGVHHFIYLTS
jgi:hypothetical protein